MTFVFVGCGNTSEKVFGVIELVGKATADKDGWKGKEVIVSGYVSNVSPHGANGYVLHMINHRRDESERHVHCSVPQGDLPEGIANTTIEVKGKIGLVTTQNYLDMKTVTLDSCELRN